MTAIRLSNVAITSRTTILSNMGSRMSRCGMAAEATLR